MTWGSDPEPEPPDRFFWRCIGLAVFALICILFAASQAHAYVPSCATMKAVRTTLSPDKLQALIANATPEQIAAGRKCFQAQSTETALKTVKGQKVTKKGPKRVKKATKHTKKRDVPLPRPAPLPKVEKVAEPLPVVNQPAPQGETVTPTVEASNQMSNLSFTLDFVKVFAFIGVLAFTYAVGKWGLIPVINAIKARGAAAAASASAFEQRVAALEQQVASLTKKVP